MAQSLSFCRLCDGRCGLKVTVEGEKVSKVEPDPSPPCGRTGACKKAATLPELIYHPNRLRRPLIRTGERGQGRWREASWGEALDLVAEKLSSLREKYGPETIALCLGHPKGLEVVMAHRFARAFGTPNIVTSGHICHLPGETASLLTLGAPCFVDPKGVPRTLVLWGNNFPDTRYGSLSHRHLTKALKDGSTLIVVDPRRTPLASRASLWVRVRPGGDWALALAVLKVVVEEGLYDEEFVEKWTVGFDDLRELVGSFPIEDLSRQSWVEVETIRAFARLYAQGRPAVIQWGNALDQTPHSFQTFRTLVILKAVTGNLDIEGGEWVTYRVPPLRPFREVALYVDRRFGPRAEKVDPGFVLLKRTVARQSFLRSVLEGHPYRIRGALVFGSNPPLTYPDARRAVEALRALEFLVVADLFMTPTAALADVVLPVAAPFEYDEIAPYPPFDGFSLCYPQLVEPQGDCWPDYRILDELLKRFVPEVAFGDARELLDFILAPSGLTFEEFKAVRAFQIEPEGDGYRERGFKTPSGKAEIRCDRLRGLGIEPLPALGPMPEPTDDYPLLLTSRKERPFLHSEGRAIPGLRRMSPEPVLEVHPDTARSLGLKEGEFALVETPRGRIRQKVAYNPSLDPRVVYCAYAWWFPERGVEDLYGWEEANLNVLTSSDPPYDPAMGSLTLRGVPCRLRPASGG